MKKIKITITKTLPIDEGCAFMDQIKLGIEQLQRGEGKIVYGGQGAGIIELIEDGQE